jgi:hypothetical protein
MPLVNTHAFSDQEYYITSSATSTTGITSSNFPPFSGTTNRMRTLEMRPNIFTVGDVVTIDACITKQGTAGTYKFWVYWNTNTTFTNAILVGVSGTVPATSTYSCFRRTLAIAGTAGSVLGTRVMADSTVTLFESGIDTVAINSTPNYEKVGDQEGLNSIDWDFASYDLNGNFSAGSYFIVAGNVSNSNDRLRCEWIRVSGMAGGSFVIPSESVDG